MNINFRIGAILYSLFLLLSLQTLNAQGYVSPFKYENGNFVRKSSSEISYEENRKYMNSYSPTKKPSTKSPAVKTETRVISREEMAYYERKREEKRKQDSIKKADRLAEYMANSWKYSNYTSTEHYKLYQRIQSLMNQMDYHAVDSITERYLTNLPSENNRSGEWDHFRARLGNRLISQLCLGRIDSAWLTFKRIELADQTALANGIYYQHTKPRDLPLIKAYLLYEGGAYDTALIVCQKFIQSLPAKDSFSVLYPEMYCLQSRCHLALGNVKEAKRSLDEYMSKTDNKSSLILNYNGFPRSYISETIGLIYQKIGKPDSALIYFHAAAKTYTELGGLESYARNYEVPFFSYVTAKFNPPIREAFLQSALLGGYALNEKENEGTVFLTIANKLGLEQADYIIENNILWIPPIKKAVKIVPKSGKKN